ncbi:MAG: hypothetical protein EOO46_17930 [Flavobacterium sp.]|nr:MAG: hypothetical protein EOO46_17930 [Flavobacterium sp.]
MIDLKKVFDHYDTITDERLKEALKQLIIENYSLYVEKANKEPVVKAYISQRDWDAVKDVKVVKVVNENEPKLVKKLSVYSDDTTNYYTNKHGLTYQANVFKNLPKAYFYFTGVVTFIWTRFQIEMDFQQTYPDIKELAEHADRITEDILSDMVQNK